MAFNVKDQATDRVVRELAAATGETLTEAVRNASREKLLRLRGRRESDSEMADIRRIAERVARLPVLDDRSPEEILGYDDHGLPG